VSESEDRAEREGFGEAELGKAQADESAWAEEAEEAGREAASIGGEAGLEELDPALRPVAEAGGGEAEGFELAEQQLRESASHGDPAGHPLADRFPEEAARAEAHTVHGEADEAVRRETAESPASEEEGQS
jgi:hypothetical protein